MFVKSEEIMRIPPNYKLGRTFQKWKFWLISNEISGCIFSKLRNSGVFSNMKHSDQFFFFKNESPGVFFKHENTGVFFVLKTQPGRPWAPKAAPKARAFIDTLCDPIPMLLARHRPPQASREVYEYGYSVRGELQ